MCAMYCNKMNKVFLSLIVALLCSSVVSAQTKSSLHQRAESEMAAGKRVNARSLWIKASEDYASRGQMAASVECGVTAAALYHQEGTYKEAFDLLREIDKNIAIDRNNAAPVKAVWRYRTSKERMTMYMNMRRSQSAFEQLDNMQRHMETAANDSLRDDFLYNKAVCNYSFGRESRGNEAFAEMASHMMSQADENRMDEAYQSLIAVGQRVGSPKMVAQAYADYSAWKDSVNAAHTAAERAALQQQIADNETVIAEQEDSLASRKNRIVWLGILAAILGVALVLVILLVLRLMKVVLGQKKTIRTAHENIALKAKFISNISSQLEPTLQRMDASLPEVRALQDFTAHLQTLSHLEQNSDEELEMEEVQLTTFCENIANQIRPALRSGVQFTVDAPRMSVKIYRPYVEHILLHLLQNAANYTPEGGHITLEFKRRGAHKNQFLVSNTGSSIPEEMRDDIFKPFVHVHDLTEGDGLGLPICNLMAVHMHGDLLLDNEFTKGTRFLFDLRA